MEDESEQIKTGTQVKIKSKNLIGTIIEIKQRGATCKVDVNGKVIIASRDDIANVIRPKKNKKASKTPTKKHQLKNTRTTNNQSTMKIDLHGRTRAETQELLIELLDRALLKGATTLEIIHGHGSGALQKEVHTFLDKNNHIANYKIVPPNTGSTIAYLK